ncbi:hypothetical protein D3C72_2389580 [compost metagenome]
MRRQPLHRMLKRVDTHIGRNRAEFSNIGVDPLTISLKIGEIADGHFTQDHPLANVGITAQFGSFELRC